MTALSPAAQAARDAFIRAPGVGERLGAGWEEAARAAINAGGFAALEEIIRGVPVEDLTTDGAALVGQVARAMLARLTGLDPGGPAALTFTVDDDHAEMTVSWPLTNADFPKGSPPPPDGDRP